MGNAFVCVKSLQPSSEQLSALTIITRNFIAQLKKSLVQGKINGHVFVGGSFAKGTLLAQDMYDVDVFIRCKEVTPQLIDHLGEILITYNSQTIRVHGSRDYFQLPTTKQLIFEVVPVKKIRKPREMENVTDLSYFHVAYVAKHMTKKLAGEIVLAKAFCASAGVYGAESYIQGFSGYALECLLIRYKTFKAMLKALVSVEKQVLIDPAKHYRSAGDLMRSMSESRRSGPLVIVDPTWPERNVAAALSQESFVLFQKRAKAYLVRPSERFFAEEAFDSQKLQKEATQKKATLLAVSLETNKQAGDIAGTKLRKFHLFLCETLGERFTLAKHVFRYEQGQTSMSYLLLKDKQSVQHGPLLSMTKHALAFKKAHPAAKMAKGRYYLTLPPVTPQIYLQQKVRKELLVQMDISRFQID